MKHYIISEEELYNMIERSHYGIGEPVGRLVGDLLKSKTPVEVIAEGKVEFHSSDCIYSVGGKAVLVYSPYTKILKRLANILYQKGKLIWVEEIK